MDCNLGSCTGTLQYSKQGGDIWYSCDTCGHMGIVPSQLAGGFARLVEGINKKEKTAKLVKAGEHRYRVNDAMAWYRNMTRFNSILYPQNHIEYRGSLWKVTT